MKIIINESQFRLIAESMNIDSSGNLIFSDSDEYDIKSILLKRVPFLKEYNIFNDGSDDERFKAQRISGHDGVTFKMGDDLLNVDRFVVHSEVTYYPHVINDITFHYFIIKNRFIIPEPGDMDELFYRIIIFTLDALSEKYSYSKEIKVRTGERISDEQLDKIINDMNKNLFAVEEYTKKHNIDLF